MGTAIGALYGNTVEPIPTGGTYATGYGGGSKYRDNYEAKAKAKKIRTAKRRAAAKAARKARKKA
jgi:hypothetical protein